MTYETTYPPPKQGCETPGAHERNAAIFAGLGSELCGVKWKDRTDGWRIMPEGLFCGRCCATGQVIDTDSYLAEEPE